MSSTQSFLYRQPLPVRRNFSGAYVCPQSVATSGTATLSDIMNVEWKTESLTWATGGSIQVSGNDANSAPYSYSFSFSGLNVRFGTNASWNSINFPGFPDQVRLYPGTLYRWPPSLNMSRTDFANYATQEPYQRACTDSGTFFVTNHLFIGATDRWTVSGAGCSVDCGYRIATSGDPYFVYLRAVMHGENSNPGGYSCALQVGDSAYSVGNTSLTKVLGTFSPTVDLPGTFTGYMIVNLPSSTNWTVSLDSQDVSASFTKADYTFA